MELQHVLIWLAVAVGVVLGVLLMIRIGRALYLRRVTLDVGQIRALQIQLTDAARQASIQPGTVVNVRPFCRKAKLREPDRRAIIDPLIERQLFAPVYQNSKDDLEAFLRNVFELVWSPTPYRVVVSQWVQVEMSKVASTTIFINQLLGSMNMTGDHNTHIGGDMVGGDKIVGDKVGRDAHKIEAGGSVVSSGNTRSSFGGMIISTEDQLCQALREIEKQAIARGEQREVVDALRWAADAAGGAGEPDRRGQSTHQRALDRASDWVREALGGVVRAASGVLASHWLIELIRG